MKSPLDIFLHRQGVHNYPASVYQSKRADLLKLLLNTHAIVALVLVATYLLSLKFPASETLFLSIGTSRALCILFWLFMIATMRYSPGVIFKFDSEVEGTYGWIPSDKAFAERLFATLQNAPDLNASLTENPALRNMTNFLAGKPSVSFTSADLLALLTLVQKQNALTTNPPDDFVKSVSDATAFFEKIADDKFQIDVWGGDRQILSHGMFTKEWPEVYITSPQGFPMVDQAKIRDF